MRKAIAAPCGTCSRAKCMKASKRRYASGKSKGETVESRFVAIEKSDITGAELRNRVAQITVRFVSQLISVTHDKAGTVIEGNPEKVTDVTDVWTFARDLSSRDPNWKLVATEAGQ